jgi:hypothetical protein
MSPRIIMTVTTISSTTVDPTVNLSLRNFNSQNGKYYVQIASNTLNSICCVSLCATYLNTGNEYAVHSTQYAVRSTQYTVHSTQYAVRSTQYAVHSTQYTESH